MVRLKKINRTGNTIEADYYPEDSSAAGHIVLDISTGKIKQHIKSDFCSSVTMYSNHAAYKLMQLAQEENLPDEYTVMWY